MSARCSCGGAVRLCCGHRKSQALSNSHFVRQKLSSPGPHLLKGCCDSLPVSVTVKESLGPEGSSKPVVLSQVSEVIHCGCLV